MKVKKTAALLSCIMLTGILFGCSSGYADGTYTAQSIVYEGIEDADGDEGGDGYGVVTLTIKDNAITDCEFTTYTTDGTIKDENYGKQNGEIANQDYYNKAQRAVKACENYAEQLVKKGDVKEVDAISGATINYDEFTEAVKLALKDAKE